MLIGELAKKTGLSRDTIRFYEKEKLIDVRPSERRTNRYKEYSSQVLEKVKLIMELKNFGFTLNEIKAILFSWEEGTFDCVSEKPKVMARVSFLEERIRQLTAMRDDLVNSIQLCPKCAILQSLKNHNTAF